MIAEVRLQQYRSHKDSFFTFSPGVNIIIGPNGSGKTNLLEALFVACSGRSYRAPDSELIMHHKKWARIDLDTFNTKRVVKIEPLKKDFIIDGKTYHRLGSNQIIPTVLFEPSHTNLITGSPEIRRNYLDNILNNIKPGFKKTRNDYSKTLRQRNYLLKSGTANKINIFPWNVRLSHLGGVIAACRTELIKDLGDNISDVYGAISGRKELISLRYLSNIGFGSYESQMLSKLEQNMPKDLIRLHTSYGPHRDDLEILIDNKQPSFIASRGETRTIAIALKTLEAENIQKHLGVEPIIFLDDVFSELDQKRSATLASLIEDRQTVITTTVLVKNLIPKNIIRIENEPIN